MNLSQWIKHSTDTLSSKGIATARLDSEVLAGHVLGSSREYILAYPETPLTDKQKQELSRFLGRRANHEPVAYIIGKHEFFGREFRVNNHTLVPRPETETMVEMLLELNSKSNLSTLVDVGTGSGAIAITAKLEIPQLNVLATDIDKKCIQTAKTNCIALETEVTFYEGDLLSPLRTLDFDVVAANLPYVPNSHTINSAAMHEPEHAIFGGTDGLELYRRLFEQAAKTKCRYLFTESLPPQHEQLKSIASSREYHLVVSKDFIQLFSA